MAFGPSPIRFLRRPNEAPLLSAGPEKAHFRFADSSGSDPARKGKCLEDGVKALQGQHRSPYAHFHPLDGVVAVAETVPLGHLWLSTTGKVGRAGAQRKRQKREWFRKNGKQWRKMREAGRV
jgi:hypothetical protein